MAPKGDGAQLAWVWPRLLEAVHPRKQLRVGLLAALFAPLLGQPDLALLEAGFSLGVAIEDHVAPVVGGLVLDPHLAPRRLLGLYLRPARRVAAQGTKRVVTVAVAILLRLLVPLVPVVVPHLLWRVLGG